MATIEEVEKIYNQMRICSNRLSEIGLDSLQMVATIPSGSETIILKEGFGNIFAREGSVSSWLESQRENNSYLFQDDEEGY